MSSIKELQERAYRQSAEKGFHEDHVGLANPAYVQYDSMKFMLMVSEVAEAMEELRAGSAPHHTYYSDGMKPEGVPSELADVVIRVMDYCQSRGIDLEDIIVEKLDYNATRGHKHGGKVF